MGSILGSVAVALLVTGVAAFLLQTQMIFPGAGEDPELYRKYSHLEHPLALDGVRLQGWRLENGAAANPGVLIYFGGNAEDVARSLPELGEMGPGTVYAYNYRGFGRSEGRPSQSALYADALAIHRAVATAHPGAPMVLVGRSLGGAVAGHVAAERPVAALVLITPFASVSKLARRTFPWLPTSLLLRHPFDLQRDAARLRAPVLVLSAEHDGVIPAADTRATFEAINAPAQMVVIAGTHHNNVLAPPEALAQIRAFISPALEGTGNGHRPDSGKL